MLNDLCFEIIQKCLNNCKFCSSNSNEDSLNMIKYEDFKRTVEYLHNKFGIKEISLSGGEPFLHPDLVEMVMLCKNLGIKTTIYTSGMVYKKPMSEEELKTHLRLLNKEFEDFDFDDSSVERAYKNEKKLIYEYYNEKYTSLDRGILSYLEWCGLDKIVFDHQALHSEILDDIMGQKKLREVLPKSISIVNKMKFEVDNHFIPTKLNYREISDLIEILDIYDDSHISILNFIPQGRGLKNKDELLLSDDDFLEFKDLLSTAMKNYPRVKVRMGIPMTKEDTHLCTAGLSKLTIRYDGYILPCPAFKEVDINSLKEYGFSPLSIYDNLSEINIVEETRDKPLCKMIHKEMKK